MNAQALGIRNLSVFSTGVGAPKRPIPADVRVEADLSEAFLRGLDAVILANPTSLHAKSALLAVQAGCNVLIEKPLSNSLADVEKLEMEVRDRNLVATIGYQFRFHPALQQIKEWLHEEVIGDVVSARAVWGEYLPAWQPWRDYRTSYSANAHLGGGVVLTLSHPIDYLRWFLGDVARVSAVTARRSGLELDVEDTAQLHLEFESGVIASVSLDYIQRPSTHHLTIVGRQGVIRWDNADGVAILEGPHRRSIAPPPEHFERNDLFVSELTHFFDCIEGREQPMCPLKDAEQTLRVCLAAKESALSGRRIDV
jgi:predicted dehydrogenase